MLGAGQRGGSEWEQRQSQVSFDPSTGQYVDYLGKPLQYQPPLQAPPTPEYMPDIRQAFEKPEAWLERYRRQVAPPTPLRLPKLEAPYQEFPWAERGRELLSQYRPPAYETEAYRPFEYTFAQQYAPPERYQGYQFRLPEISELERVQPVAEDIWSARAAAAGEATGERFGDIRERTRDEIIRSGMGSEQAAAVMANLDVQEEKARRESQRDIDIARAGQAVGISQQEQQLGLQRGTAQAGLEAQTQERQAQELATRYNLDIDAARYMVQQQAGQQQLAGGERRFGQEFGLGERRYGFQTGLEEARYGASQRQWGVEQEAAEKEKAWQSRYGRSQDVAQTSMAQQQADWGRKLDYWNAVLQGSQAAAQQAAQQATYAQNLPEGERKDIQKQKQEYQTWEQGLPKGIDPRAVEANPEGYKQWTQAKAKQYQMPQSKQTGGYA